MSYKPILFSTPMVQALLAGKKTMTRRVLKPQPVGTLRKGQYSDMPNAWFDDVGYTHKPKCNVGDILWVRETFRIDYLSNIIGYGRIHYKADDSFQDFNFHGSRYDMMRRQQLRAGWRPNENMPKEACRLFLRVTDVRVERLQDITDADARAEGCGESDVVYYNGALKCMFFELWDSINEKRGFGWEKNPWVWVYIYERVDKPEGWCA